MSVGVPVTIPDFSIEITPPTSCANTSSPYALTNLSDGFTLTAKPAAPATSVLLGCRAHNDNAVADKRGGNPHVYAYLVTIPAFTISISSTALPSRKDATKATISATSDVNLQATS